MISQGTKVTNIYLSNILFIGGFPSGGTDLTKTVINAHPEIDIRGEMPLLISLEKHGFNYQTIFSDLKSLCRFTDVLSKADIYNRIGNLNHDFSIELSNKGELSLEEALFIVLSKEKASIRGFKTPQYTEQMPALSRLFPNAKFVIVVRDVRDTCLSWSRKWGKDRVYCAEKWANRMKAGFEYAQGDLQKRVLFVKYEDLLEDPTGTAKKICDFIGVVYSKRMVEHEKHTKERIDGKLNYGKKIISTNKEKWRTQLTYKDILRIEEIAFNTMRLFEYEIEYATSPRSITVTEKYLGRLKDVYSMFFIGNRALSQKNRSKIMFKSIYLQLKKRF